MIDARHLRRLLGGSGLLLSLAALAALALGSPSWAAGLLLGYVLGAVPFASWAWIAARGMASGRNRALAALLMLGKFGLYAGLLYLLVTRELASPVGVMIGITAVVGVMSVGSLLQPAPTEAPRC